MKKFFAILLAGVLTVGLAACGGSDDTAADDSNNEEITLRIGAVPTPHAEILEAAKDELAEKGVKLDIVEFTDYVQPNLATESGDLDVNYFQHLPYLEQFNQEQGTHLVPIAKVHYEPMSIFGGTVTDLNNIPDGTKVGIPNDATNGGRALLLLEANGLIKLDPDAGITATKLDVVETPHNLEFVEMEAAQLPLSLSDLGLAVINANYAIQNELTGALAVEDAQSEAAQTYANLIVVKEGNENLPGLAELVEVLHGQTITDFINNTYGGAVAPIQ